MRVWWILVFHFLCSILVAMAFDDTEKCLDIPEVSPQKYFHLKSKSLTINLEMSSRVTHQLSTQVFYIFIKEVLGYFKIAINTREDNFIIDPVIERLSDYSHAAVSEPPATINLEVWIRPDYDTYATHFVEECGTIAPPGRFGWFIPAELDKPLKAYYAKHKWTEYIQEVHWSFFIDPTMVQPFDISNQLLDTLLAGNSKAVGTGEYFCNNKTFCERSMYTPKQCEEQVCAILLAPHYEYTGFLIDQIEEMKLLVKVIWLGDNLKKVVKEMRDLYKLENTTQSIVFFNWFPSDVIVDQREFYTVLFANNEIMNFTRNEEVGYKYEMHRLVKLAWSKIEKNAAPLYEGLRSFKLSEDDYVFMLKMYNKYYGQMTTREIACRWMRENPKKWNWWKKESPTVIYIGGIFPITATSFNGIGVVQGAFMAQKAINKNSTILANYDLKLLLQDGQCKADNVMKNFIDFIVEGYYPQLVGVLGPACSETVEPLAGVSRHYHIMVISYSAEGASFADRTKYPYFFRTIGENRHYMKVYLYIFKYFGWKRVAALTEDGQKSTEYISLMQDDLEKNNIKFIANKKFPRERETLAMTRYLEDLKSMRARIIIADVVDEVARTVMCEAYKLEMTSAQGYVWFFPMWLNAKWYDTDHFNLNATQVVNCTTKEMKKAILGYFSMTHAYFAPDNAIMQENITVGQWRKNYTRFSRNPSNYAGFAYDAVWVYALALDKLGKTDPEAMSDLHSENTTNKLVKLVEETDFYGVSGRIKFRGGPSRFSIINIFQWYNDSLQNIGHFYPNLSDNKPEILGGDLRINTTAVKWFTPDKSKPEDGTLPPKRCGVQWLCNIFNIQDCDCTTGWIVLMVTIITIVSISMGMTFLWLRHGYEKRIRKTTTYIKSLGFTFDVNNTRDLDKWEISREAVVINRKLGEGAFGTVYGGEANLLDVGWCAVAVKTLKIGSTTEEKLDFLSEAEVMKRFDHKNIIKLLGVCTKDEPIYTIMEFMLYGDLKTFLLARRNLVNRNSEESEEVSPKKLTSMALDVARGLSYLAELKYVHRDVASRNCLVNAQRCVKIGDFGMTRAMFDNDYYKFTRKGMLPVRWMSPESLELGLFTTSSDVWSYGVLLYEIITFGSFPWQGKSNSQVLELVKSGHTLDIPKGVKPNLEALLKSCWNRDSKLRPSASELVEFLANNPRLLSACLDVPSSSVQLEDRDQAELGVPSEFRKFSVSSKVSPTRPVAFPMQTLAPSSDDKSDNESITMDPSCPKEPLLGTSKPSSSSLLNIGKFVRRRSEEGNNELTAVFPTSSERTKT